ncbi:MAG: hypothetical protein NC311_11505 [Muribaculaceae bacterium]|nr:hypothetical protein [Muribaculaceae bacterium]
MIETLAKVINIEAKDPFKALEEAERMWFDGDIEWNALDDHVDHEVYMTDDED